MARCPPTYFGRLLAQVKLAFPILSMLIRRGITTGWMCNPVASLDFPYFITNYEILTDLL